MKKEFHKFRKHKEFEESLKKERTINQLKKVPSDCWADPGSTPRGRKTPSSCSSNPSSRAALSAASPSFPVPSAPDPPLGCRCLLPAPPPWPASAARTAAARETDALALHDSPRVSGYSEGILKPRRRCLVDAALRRRRHGLTSHLRLDRTCNRRGTFVKYHQPIPVTHVPGRGCSIQRFKTV
jgi:hypothetical protein